MKRFLPFLLPALGLALVCFTLRPARPATAFDVAGFGRLPTLVNGRVKPLDTVARTSLLMLQGRQRVVTPAGSTLEPVAWLLDMLFRPELADTYQTLEIVHPDLLTLLHLTVEAGAGGKRFAYAQLAPHLAELDRQARLAQPVPASERTPFQRAVLQLQEHLLLYQRLQQSLVPPDTTDLLDELRQFEAALPAGVAAARAKAAQQPYDEAALRRVLAAGQRYDTLAQNAYLLAVPPPAGSADPHAWRTVGAALLESFGTGQIDPHAFTYAGLARTWRAQSAPAFNELVRLYGAALATPLAPDLRRCALEARFNAAQPFYTATWLYVLAFLTAVVSWLVWPRGLARSAFWLTVLAFALTTAGIALRMWLEGRPPVTNLYSSALFVGWAAVALCLALEVLYRNAVGSVTAGLVGFSTLIVAHHLALGGDTMEMMRAVLDSNFWLTTHVVTIAIGYSATFLAGLLGAIYLVRGALTRSLDRATADALSRMVYGIVAFATIFSFVGTVLGGIWADQSWGRFWGWDPKENGALILVLWNAIYLHARKGRLLGPRGLMALAVGGNIVTAWSWFGVNLLGVGLHSYGFTERGALALGGFVLGNLVIAALAALPSGLWRSQPDTPPATADHPRSG